MSPRKHANARPAVESTPLDPDVSLQQRDEIAELIECDETETQRGFFDGAFVFGSKGPDAPLLAEAHITGEPPTARLLHEQKTFLEDRIEKAYERQKFAGTEKAQRGADRHVDELFRELQRINEEISDLNFRLRESGNLARCRCGRTYYAPSSPLGHSMCSVCVIQTSRPTATERNS